jgi:hypothetical protein
MRTGWRERKPMSLALLPVPSLRPWVTSLNFCPPTVPHMDVLMPWEAGCRERRAAHGCANAVGGRTPRAA